MRIGIDARFWGPEGKGLGRYTQKLIENLQLIDQSNEYWIFLRENNYDIFLPSGSNIHKVRAPYRWYSIGEQIGFARLLYRHRLDVMHFPHFNVPLLYRRPFVVTIHDLIITNFPTKKATTLGPLKYFVKRMGYQFVISAAVRRAKQVITVSEYVKRDLMEYFNLSSRQVTVTYEAADMFTGFSEDTDAIMAQYALTKPYLLYVGNAYPHKNLEVLVSAFHDLAPAWPGLRLVLVGKADYFFNRLAEFTAALGLGDRVVFPGYIPDQHLPVLYRQALAYVFPSLSEGFGLPPLEAMQYGLPVAAARSSCLPEILGNGAIYFDPKDKHDIVQVLSDLLLNPQLREQLRSRGLERVKQFSWRKMAEETLKCYQSIQSHLAKEKEEPKR